MRDHSLGRLLTLLWIPILGLGGCLRHGFDDDSVANVWVGNSYQVERLPTDGVSMRFEENAHVFLDPRSVSPVEADGSVWVVDHTYNEAVHVDSEGEVLSRTESIYYEGYLWETAVNQYDQSVWVADKYHLYHYSAEGELLLRKTDVWPASHEGMDLQVHPVDRSVWLAHTEAEQIYRFDAAGNEMWVLAAAVVERPHYLAMDPTDGSAWVIDTTNNVLVHLDSDGSELHREAAGVEISYLQRADDGTLWACRSEVDGFGLAHFSASGVLHGDSPVTAGLYDNLQLAPDGSFWLISSGSDEIVHFSATGSELFRSSTTAVGSARTLTRSGDDFWVLSSAGYDALVRIDETGEQQGSVSTPEFFSIGATALDRSARELWIADNGRDLIVRLNADAEVTAYSAPLTFYNVSAMAVDQASGTLWVIETDVNEVFTLGADGAVISRSSDQAQTLVNPVGLAIDPADGSAWVTDDGEIVHFSSDVTLLNRFAVPLLSSAGRIALDSNDGSLWVLSGTTLAHLSGDGVLLSAGNPNDILSSPSAMIVASDGAVWIADEGRDQLVVLESNGTERFHTLEGSYLDVRAMAEATDGTSIWVADNNRWQLANLDLEGNEVYRSTPDGIRYPTFLQIE